MADNATITARTSSETTSVVVSADEAASGLVQRLKLAYSADGADTHVQADAEGLLVSANPKVAVASNTGSQVSVTTGAGGVEVLASNASRNGFTIIIEGDAYLSFGGTPTASTFKLSAFVPYNMLSGVIYTGQIKALSVSGTVIANVVEF